MHKLYLTKAGGGRLAFLLGTLHNGGAGHDTERRDVWWRWLAGDSVGDENNRPSGNELRIREASGHSVRGRTVSQWDSMLDMFPIRDHHNIGVRYEIQPFCGRENAKYHTTGEHKQFRYGIPGARLIIAGVPA